MNSEKLTFNNLQGDQLSARLDLALDGKPVAYALFAHCFTCSKNLKAVHHISRALTRQRIAVLRFDFTGLGESEGDFAETTFYSNVDDLLAAASFLEKEYQAPKILVGHSLGGAAVLQAADRISSSVAVATIAAPYDPQHVTHLLGSDKQTIEEKGEAQVTLAGRTFKIKKKFLDDLQETNMQEKIRSLKRALLVLHSPVDNTVGIENAARIFESALHPKSFISLDKADHLLIDEKDSLYTGSVLAAWASKYIGAQSDAKSISVDPEENLVVAQTGEEGYYTEIMANGHPLISDEPLAYGGTNQGASPYELLAASLGACSGMTLRMYADRKEWPLKAVKVRLRHQKIHAHDCQACDTREGKIDELEREIELFGELDDTQKQRLLEIADKCPVHRTLHSEIKINTTLRKKNPSLS